MHVGGDVFDGGVSSGYSANKKVMIKVTYLGNSMFVCFFVFYILHGDGILISTLEYHVHIVVN